MKNSIYYCMKISWVLVFILSACGDGNDLEAPDHQDTFESAKHMRMHMEVLASDEMEGRETGTAGFEAAADYVAEQFQEAKLQALGDGGSYFQKVQLMSSSLVPETAGLEVMAGEITHVLANEKDFIQSGGFGEKVQTVTAPLIFVGYGVRAPEFDHDDYLGIDAEGKIVVMFTGAPPHFSTDERAYYSSGTVKSADAEKAGAVGSIVIRTAVDAQRLPWERMVRFSTSIGMRWVGPDGHPHNSFPQLRASVMLSENGAKTLFKLAGRNLKAQFETQAAGYIDSFEMNLSAHISRQSEHAILASRNIIGMIPGSDPRLRHQYIFVTAHLDHLGYRETDEGKEIHNGAYDNAAGVGVILALSKALAVQVPAVRRSVVFVALTGEEKGLRGSDYLANNPPVPIDQIVANLNIDMPYLGHPIADIEGLGVEHSTLHAALMDAAKSTGLKLTPDPRPELVRFIRSDQFSFVKQGVPGLNLKAGSMSTDREVDGAAMRNAFLQDHYHTASDDLALPYSEEGANRFFNVALAFVTKIANDDEDPKWVDGDFFGNRFGRKNSSDQ